MKDKDSPNLLNYLIKLKLLYEEKRIEGDFTIYVIKWKSQFFRLLGLFLLTIVTERLLPNPFNMIVVWWLRAPLFVVGYLWLYDAVRAKSKKNVIRSGFIEIRYELPVMAKEKMSLWKRIFLWLILAAAIWIIIDGIMLIVSLF